MKKLFLLFFVMPLFAHSQENSVLSELLATSSDQNHAEIELRINSFVDRLAKPNASTDLAFLKKVFHQTEKTFFTQYVAYSSFGDIFSSGKYDCLTATSLFSVVLDRLGFDYRIIETNYHIFLLVQTSGGEVLLETTDRMSGFVKNQKDIRRHIGNYREGPVRASQHFPVLQYSFDLYQQVIPHQLPGLLYYNQAVRLYNEGNLEQCADVLEKAHSLYASPRINEFCSVYLQSVASSRLDSPVKQRIILQFRNLISLKSVMLTSR